MVSINSLRKGFAFRYRRLQLYRFSVIHGRWKDYLFFLVKVFALWFGIWVLTALIPALLTSIPNSIKIAGEFEAFLTGAISFDAQSFISQYTQSLQDSWFIQLLIEGSNERDFGIFNIVAYSAGSIITGYLLIAMLRPKRIISISNKFALTTLDTDGRQYLVFRFATAGSALYDMKAELDFSTASAQENPLDPRENHSVFELPGNKEESYSELIGVHELYFPFDSKPKGDPKDKTLQSAYEDIIKSDYSHLEKRPSAKLRIIAHTADGYPVNESKDFDLVKSTKEEGKWEEVAIKGAFAKTLRSFKWHCLSGEKRYYLKYFNSIDKDDPSSTD